MIHDLCNIFPETDLDTFHQANIIDKNSLSEIIGLEKREDVLAKLNALQITDNALQIPLIPKRYQVSNSTGLRSNKTIYNTRVSLDVQPMDRNLKELFENWNNKEVLIYLIRRTHAHLYGTTLQPLILTYQEVHSTESEELKGFNLTIQGNNYSAPFYFNANDINEHPMVRGLAFELSGEL